MAEKKRGRPPGSKSPKPRGEFILDTNQAAKLVGLGAATIRRAIEEGELAGRDFGRGTGIRTTREALMAWVEGRNPEPEETDKEVEAEQ